MAKELTTEQKSVVEHRSGALLVSASAGSGKTRVLVERVLAKLCDPVHPADIDSLLIVSFTTAAAAELRTKLSEKISERLAENPSNAHLRQQLTRLCYAQISTVHAFCAELLRSYAHLADIPADFRIAEEAQSEILRQSAAEAAIEYAYAQQNTDENFSALLDTLGYRRDDRQLTALLTEAYNCIQAHARPMAWLQECRAELEKIDGGVEQTVWGISLSENFRKFCRAGLLQMQHCTEVVNNSPAIEKYRTVVEEMQTLLTAYSTQSWDELAANSEIQFARLPVIRNCDDPVAQEHVKALRNQCKELLKKWLSHFSDRAEVVTEKLAATRKPLLGFFALLEKTEELFKAEKRKRRLLDFADLEHEAVKLLLDRDNRPTAVAREVSARFTEIMVDEYQDASSVQDAIYHAVSKNGENLFFVGDVKQSIYSFRLADPTIFLEKYKTYAERDNSGSGARKIRLSKNFRSSAEILEAVNDVFTTVMSEEVGGLDYTQAEQMQCGGSCEKLPEPAVELHLLKTESENPEAETDALKVEAQFVAKRISELLDGTHTVHDENGLRPIRPGDVAILIRSFKGAAKAFLDALAAEGIPAVGRNDADLLDTTHVQSFLAFLRIIENPHSDFRMAAALTSPVGGFTAEDTAKLRILGGGRELYASLRLAAATDAKSAAFLQTLDELREARRWMPLGDFLDRVMDTLQLTEVFGAVPDGAVRCAELRTFRAFCGNVIRRGTEELGALLRYLDEMRENGEPISAEDRQGADCVHIMTIHTSKGLEFPVVFLCKLTKRFNNEDSHEILQTDAKLMAGCNVIDRELMASYRSAALEAITQKRLRDQKSEEMRLLYVAMTRAKSRLILTLCGDGLEKKMSEIANLATYPAMPLCVGEKTNSFASWILYAAAVRPEAAHLFGGSFGRIPAGHEKWLVELHENTAEKKKRTAAETVRTSETINTDCLGLNCTFFDIPAKLTATQLKGRQLDEESADGARTVTNRKPQMSARGFSPDGRPLTATERGTAVHRFLQFCRYEACVTKTGIAEEKARLVQNAFLTQAEADCVDAEKLLHFFASDLGREVLTANNRMREYKFSLLVDAGRYLDGARGEPVMLQGVVDCFWQTDAGLCILDFKTDAVTKETARKRAEDYRGQLEAYAAALSEIYGVPVARKILYFFAADEVVEY